MKWLVVIVGEHGDATEAYSLTEVAVALRASKHRYRDEDHRTIREWMPAAEPGAALELPDGYIVRLHDSPTVAL